MSKQAVFDAVESERDRLFELATTLWENPELGMREYDAVERLQGILREEGFDVEESVAGIETAFLARYGEDDPVVGVLGEYDALPDLSQAVAAEREPLEEGAPGHGCGHNLFAAGSLGAVLGAKRAIERGDVSGTVVYFGTPAEELGVGKPYMISDGAFDDVDAVLSWHPGWYSSASRERCLALDSLRFEFTGEASHAGAAPEAGRSALDAVQVMNVGVEFMREHVPDNARIHYAIDDAGAAPNVVDPNASVLYTVRAPTRASVDEMSEWLHDVARGAALITQTDVESTYRGGMYGVLPNDTLADVIDANMQAVGGFELPADDRQLAAELKATIDGVEGRIEQLPAEHHDDAREQPMLTDAVPSFDGGELGTYSTDTGNVSWVVPVGRSQAATWPVGTPAHSWQAVAASGSVGRHAAVFVAKALAGGLYDLLDDPEIVAAARAEFESASAGTDYEETLPEVDPSELAAD